MESPFPEPELSCECGKTEDFCDNGLCYTWTSRAWRWLRALDLNSGAVGSWVTILTVAAAVILTACFLLLVCFPPSQG